MTDDILVAEMKRLSSTWPGWMNGASYEQAQDFRLFVARAAKLAERPSRHLEQWRTACRMKIIDFDTLRYRVEHRFADAG